MAFDITADRALHRSDTGIIRVSRQITTIITIAKNLARLLSKSVLQITNCRSQLPALLPISNFYEGTKEKYC